MSQSQLARVAIEAERITLALYRGLTELLDRTALVPTAALVESLRAIKDSDELGEIHRSITIAERSFQVIRASLRPDQTERELAANLEHQIRLFGGEGLAFPAIVGVGPRSALPHGIPGKQRVEDGELLLIDWGARAGLYLSDLTRVLVTGKLSPKLQGVYEIVLEAQLAAIDRIRPGALAGAVDEAARQVIAAAGYGEFFGHNVGHGFGLEIHEAPKLGVGQEDPLQVGMVVTVEPGIYIPGWGGVRIEDDVLVTPTGHEVLTSLAKDLASCRAP
jgi:Xaa-Pro aminopeptidase